MDSQYKPGVLKTYCLSMQNVDQLHRVTASNKQCTPHKLHNSYARSQIKRLYSRRSKHSQLQLNLLFICPVATFYSFDFLLACIQYPS
ncbi:hypothetical protein WP8S18E06_18470 [Klebsiella sp. WP8-S18-ESBL-06]|nr:hypothetical protein WP8S18E06_18470 [Klebsiella sp. WP8-S18-ESBL-06]